MENDAKILDPYTWFCKKEQIKLKSPDEMTKKQHSGNDIVRFMEKYLKDCKLK